MEKTKIKIEKRARRHKRIRAKVKGTPEAPRLSVFKSNRYVYAQLVDDSRGVTLAAASSAGAKGKTLLERSKETGMELAKAAVGKKIKKVVFDRGGYVYTGKVKAIAEGAREGGLEF